MGSGRGNHVRHADSRCSQTVFFLVPILLRTTANDAPGGMKPVGDTPYKIDNQIGDEDAHFLQRALGLSASPALVSPVVITQDFRMRAFLEDCGNLMQPAGKGRKLLYRSKIPATSRGGIHFLFAAALPGRQQNLVRTGALEMPGFHEAFPLVVLQALLGGAFGKALPNEFDAVFFLLELRALFTDFKVVAVSLQCVHIASRNDLA